MPRLLPWLLDDVEREAFFKPALYSAPHTVNVVSEYVRFEARARDGDVGLLLVDQFGTPLAVDVDDDAFDCRALGGVTGERVSMVEVPIDVTRR